VALERLRVRPPVPKASVKRFDLGIVGGLAGRWGGPDRRSDTAWGFVRHSSLDFSNKLEFV
jgi:hypothetical protein